MLKTKIIKQTKFAIFQLWLVLLFTAAYAPVSAQVGTQIDAPDEKNHRPEIVTYDRLTDQLTVNAQDISLRNILGNIAKKSGIEVLFDGQADAVVSISIQSQSLESGLKDLLRGHSHSFRFSRDVNQKLLLVGVTVLPVGEEDGRRAKRIGRWDDEAYYRARNQLSMEQIQQVDMVSERWQARISELPPEVRKKLDEKLKARLIKEAKREQRMAEDQKRRQQLEVERKADRQKMRQQNLSKASPDERAEFERKGDEAREKVKALLFK